MTTRILCHSVFHRRTACTLVVSLLPLAFASSLCAGFIATSVGVNAKGDVTVPDPSAPGGVTQSTDDDEGSFEPPPSILFPATVNANAGFSSAGANAAIDTSGNLGLRTVVTSRDTTAVALARYTARYDNFSTVATNVDLQWLIGPLNFSLIGARDATVTLHAFVAFNLVGAFSARMTLEVDSDGNVSPASGLTVTGEAQPLPPFVVDGNKVSLTNFLLPVPVDFVLPPTGPGDSVLNQTTSFTLTATTGSFSPEFVSATLDDPFNLSGNSETSVRFLGDEPGTAPVPEPSSILLLACGQIVLCGYARRRRKHAA